LSFEDTFEVCDDDDGDAVCGESIIWLRTVIVPADLVDQFPLQIPSRMLRKMMFGTKKNIHIQTVNKFDDQPRETNLSELRDDLTDRSTEASERSLDEIYVPRTFKCRNCNSTSFVSQSSCDNQFCGKDCMSSYSLFHTLPAKAATTKNRSD
jgi:hypothetical protein